MVFRDPFDGLFDHFGPLSSHLQQKRRYQKVRTCIHRTQFLQCRRCRAGRAKRYLSGTHLRMSWRLVPRHARHCGLKPDSNLRPGSKSSILCTQTHHDTDVEIADKFMRTTISARSSIASVFEMTQPSNRQFICAFRRHVISDSC